MGSSRWDDTYYNHVVEEKVKTRGTAFTYDADVKTGAAPKKVHKLLDAKGLKVRESRDSKEHPESNAIIVSLDVTGSMDTVIKTIHGKLPSLMGLLTRKNYIPDPQILFAAVGDATCDTTPLQVGQFESGVEMEGDLSRFFLEGGGGGQATESYELMAYVGARKTSIDCFEKRGKKGYFFFIGDEKTYPKVKKHEVEQLIGKELEADIPVKDIFVELAQKYQVFYVLPAGAAHGHDRSISSYWEELIGTENVLRLEDPSAVAELIASQIGLCEGVDVDTVANDLKDVGTSAALVKVVTGSVSRAYGGGAVTKVAAGTLEPSTDPSSVKRL